MTVSDLSPGALCRHLTDMRRFADLTRDETPGTDYLSSRHLLDFSDSDTRVGTIDLGVSSGVVTKMASYEFVIALEGSLHISGDVSFTIQPGESAVLPRNARFAWENSKPALLAFICHKSQSLARRHPFKNEISAPRVPAPLQPFEHLIGPQPVAHWNLEYISEGGGFTTGSCDGTSVERRHFLYDFFELIHFTEEDVDVTDPDGKVHSFHADDIVAVRKGATLGWSSGMKVEKVAALCRIR